MQNKTPRTLVPLALVCAAAPATASPQCADGYEPNDTCATAAAVSAGTAHWARIGLSSSDLDHFRYTVPAGQTLEVRAEIAYPFGLFGGVTLIDGGDCQTVLADGDYDEDIRFANASGAARDVVVRVVNNVQGCESYTLRGRLFADPCPGLPGDPYEPNDSSQAAATIPRGHFPGLTVGAQDPDHYLVPILRGALLSVTIESLLSGPDHPPARAALFDPATGEANGSDWFDGTRRRYNYGSVDAVEIRVDVPVGTGCNAYDLTVEVDLTGCELPPDAFEPNDNELMPAVVTAGLHPDLNVTVVGVDHYSVIVPALSAAAVEVRNVPGTELRDVAVVPQLFSTGVESVPGRTRFLLVNGGATPGPRHFTARVDPPAYFLTGRAPCAVYDLRVDDAAPGTTTCTAAVNSTGGPAVLSLVGSPAVADDRLALFARGLPLPGAKLSFFGLGAAQAPLGNGTLCVAPPLVRMTGATPGAVWAHWIDFDAHAQQLLPGNTVHFQVWFRDGSSSNLTNAVAVTLQ